MNKLKVTPIIIIFIFIFASLCPFSWSQEAKASEREAMYYRYLAFSSSVKGGSIQPHWMTDGECFWFAEGVPDRTVIYKVSPKTNLKEPLFDTERLRQALTPLLGFEPPYKGLPFKEFAFVDGEKKAAFSVEGREFICDLDSYKITPVPALSEEEKNRMIPRLVRKGIMAGVPDVLEILSPDGRWFLGAKDHNLCLQSTYDGRSNPLTQNGIKDYEWDVEDAQWSPNSLKVAVFKIDMREVPDLPLLHYLKQKEEVEWVHFTKAGEPLPQQELYIIDIFSKKQIRVNAGDQRDQILGIIGWTPDGSELLFGRMDREYKKSELMAASFETGSSRVILAETQKTFVVQFGLSSPNFQLLKDGKKFIWISERDGWNHLYLYDMKGTLIRRLTKGIFPVIGISAVDEKRGWIYFTAHGEGRLYDIHLYKVNFEGQSFSRLTEAPGQHEILFSPSNEFYLDTHSTVESPPVVELRKADGSLVQIISKADIEALKDLKWSPPEEFVVKAADKKTDLYGVLYKPYDFDANKQYPVIDSIYNGPQITWVPRTFTSPLAIWPQALAQLGFVVFVVDGRGTPERGKEFQDVVFGNFGRNEIPDHVATLNQLAEKRPYMDLKRVGIFGGSFGGYMTVRAMLLAPDVYQVGVASVPVVDLYDLMASAAEPFMGLPQNNKEGYDYGSSLRLAGDLKGKLLLIHGTSDVNATFSATMKLVEAFIRANKPFGLIVMPDQGHWISGASRTYWMEAVRKYFQDHLKP